MTSACEKLFQYTADFVTPEDIEAFAPDDPGYASYVRTYQEILESRTPPVRGTFDVIETIGLTRWVDAKKERESVRFRRFRMFTTAVELTLAVREWTDVKNYAVIRFVDDAFHVADELVWPLLAAAFQELHNSLAQARDDELTFVSAGLLLVAAHERKPDAELSSLAERVISEEGAVADRHSENFLFGLTLFDQMNENWKWCVRELIKPTTPVLALVRDAILAHPTGLHDRIR